MATGKVYTRQTFISLFDSIARHKHRYTVFSDFVFMSAVAIHNAICKSEVLEKEYLEIVKRYSKAEVNSFCELIGNFIFLIDAEPRDILGSLYMELELGNLKNGQFFTPHEISLLLAKIVYGGKLEQLENSTLPFIQLSEPACGAGGMVLAFAGEMIRNKQNPAEKLFAKCIDIDRITAFMCYLQLSLWNIPAQIIIGDTLKMEWREIYYTPAYYLENWEIRLRIRRFMEIMESSPEPAEKTQPQNENGAVEPNTHTNHQKTKTQSSTIGFQQGDLFSFDFQIDH